MDKCKQCKRRIDERASGQLNVCQCDYVKVKTPMTKSLKEIYKKELEECILQLVQLATDVPYSDIQGMAEVEAKKWVERLIV